MTTRNQVHRNGASLIAAATMLLASATLVGAQQTQLASNDARWTPWVGCWQASARDAITQQLSPDKAMPVVCIAPAEGAGMIDLITVNGTTASTPEHIDANGAKRTVNREGCTGWETAEFSPNGKRIYLRSEHQCTGNRVRTSTGVMSISPNGEWLDVQGVKVDANNGVRVAHYGRVPTPAVLSMDLKAKLQVNSLDRSTSVLAASDSLRTADVVEANKHLDPLVLQTWLAQRGQGYNVDAKQLQVLADGKVPTNVIDVMVALSYPTAFAINLAQLDGQVIPTGNPRQLVADEEAVGNGPTIYMNWDPMFSNGYDYFGFNSMYGYSRGGYPGYYPGFWYQGNTPVIITRPSETVNIPEPDRRGRLVRGSGYTGRDGSSSGGSPRSSTSGGSGSGSSAGSTGSSSGGSSSSGGERTAKPRKP